VKGIDFRDRFPKGRRFFLGFEVVHVLPGA
jgi:hypothetical protein